MKTLILNKNTISLGKVTLEPFEIIEGSIATIEWPLNIGSVDEDNLIKILCDGRSIGGINVFETATKATPLKRKALKLKNSRIPELDKLTDLMDEYTKERFISELDNPVSHLPQTLRVLIAIHLSCIESSFVLYESSGMDPMGLITTIDWCRKKSNLGWSFIYLRHPSIDEIDSSVRNPVAKIVIS